MKKIQVSPELKQFSKKYSLEMLFGKPSTTGLGAKIPHCCNVIKIAEQRSYAQQEEVNIELVQILARLHDLGRSIQWEATKSFNDRLVNHRYLGQQLIEQYIRDNQVEITPDWMILMDVIAYHGIKHMWDFASPLSLPYLEIISDADDIENGCTGALSYLEDEKARDDKGYIAINPEKDQRDCKPELLGYLERGEKFNKATLCETYAEYFVFAATLAVNSCIQHGDIAKKAMAMPALYKERQGDIDLSYNGVAGYCRLFEKHLHPEDAKNACAIIKRMCE